MSPYLNEPLAPNHRNLSARAHARGTSFESELSEFISRETGNVKPDALTKLDQRQAKLESQIADLEAERGKALGIAAKYHTLTVEADRLRKQLEVAKGKLELHKASAAESHQNAKLRLGDTADQWTIAGNLLGISLEQDAIARAMEPLIDALAAELATKEGEVLAYAQSNGIAAGSSKV